MDFLAALNVTIYGLGIVFLALLVLMFTIMVLSKLFSVATGKELLEAPNPGARPQARPVPAAAPPVPAPAPPAIATVAAPSPEAAPVPAAGPEPARLTLSLGGRQHRVELREVTAGGATVVMDGASFRVDRDRADVKTVMVNGQSHTIEVREVTDTAASVIIDGVPQTIQIAREAPLAPAAPTATTRVVKKKRVVSGGVEQVTAPLPGKILSLAVQVGDQVKRGDELCVVEAMKMGNSIKAQRDGTVQEIAVSVGQTVNFGALLVTLATGGVVEEEVEEVVAVEAAATVTVPPPSIVKISADGKQYSAEVRPGSGSAATVTIDGATFQIARDPQDVKKVAVNGQSHTLEIKEVTDTTATVVVDGVERKVGLTREVVPAPVSASAAPAVPPPAPPPVRVATPAPAPAPVAPAPAPVAPAAAPVPPSGGEPITAPLPGKILSVSVQVGDLVKRGDELCVIEAMKMGNSIKAQRAGTIKGVLVSPGQTVGFGATLLMME